MKNIIIKLLNLVRRVLTVFKNHCLPLPSPSSLTPYEMYANEQIKNCFDTFKSHFQQAIFLDQENYHKFIIEKALENDSSKSKFYLEFGVWTGTSINFFSKYVNIIYGFDSFKGLREDWIGTTSPKGTFNLGKKLPKLNKKVFLVVGWVQDTLVPFLDKHKPEINFVHMDVDTYESTKFILTKIKPYLVKNCIIAFDELYNYPGWQNGEYKALKEVFNDHEYKFICFSTKGEQAAIQLII